jgi:hypothetical protein
MQEERSGPYRKRTRLTVSDETIVRKIFQDHALGISGHKIAKKLNISSWTTYKILSNKKDDAATIAKGYVDYTCNESVFEHIDTREKAYWVGFLAADGNITERCLRIRLAKKDLDHLEKLKTFLCSDHPIRNYVVDGHDCCDLAIHSKKIVSDLIAHGFSYNKTWSLSVPKIDQLLLSSYILGVFDGDGSFARNGKGGARFSLSGCEDHLNQIQQVLIHNCSLSKTKLYKGSGCYLLEYQGRFQIKRICDFMYRDINVFLARKRNVVKELYGF